VLGVRVFGRLYTNASAAARLASQTAALLRRAGGPDVGSFGPEEIEVAHEDYGDGYGHPTPAAEEARGLMRELEGIELETTYTAKALAALRRRAPALARKRVLFWNTFSSTSTENLERADPAALPSALRRYV
jgi:D-cysteine desulfhydrase